MKQKQQKQQKQEQKDYRLQFEKLQKQNEKLKEDINKITRLWNHSFHENIWKLINNLIENELQQEELCNE